MTELYRLVGDGYGGGNVGGYGIRYDIGYGYVSSSFHGLSYGSDSGYGRGGASSINSRRRKD